MLATKFSFVRWSGNYHIPDDRRGMVVTEEGVRSIVAAAYAVDAAEQWDGDLARLIVVLAATGGRFSQVVRLTVADVQERERA